MKTAKEEALNLIRQLPDEASLETILAELHFLRRVVQGLKEVERDEVVSHDDVKASADAWLKSIGP